MAQTTSTVQIPITAKVPNLDANSGTVAIVFFGPAKVACTLTGIDWQYATKGSNATCTWNVFKDTGTTAPGGGTSVLTGGTAIDVGTNTATVANTTTAATLTATGATLALAVGDRLSYQMAGTLTALVGLCLNATILPQ